MTCPMVKGGKRTRRQRKSKKQRGGAGEVVPANNTPESKLDDVRPAEPAATTVPPETKKSMFSSFFSFGKSSKEQPNTDIQQQTDSQPQKKWFGLFGGKRNKTSKRKKC